MSNTEAEKRPPSRGHKHICVPFASEAHYQECVEDVAQYRQYLTTMSQQHPELFGEKVIGVSLIVLGAAIMVVGWFSEGAALERYEISAPALFSLVPVETSLIGSMAVVDAVFLASNAAKFLSGGWFPVLIGSAIFVLLMTWKRGRALMFESPALGDVFNGEQNQTFVRVGVVNRPGIEKHGSRT